MILWTIFAMFIMFAALPFIFSQETKKAKHDDFEHHVETAIGMYTPKK